MEEFRVPKETVNDETVTVVWLVDPVKGPVQKGDRVAELETSKANVDVEAPGDGFVRFECAIGDELPVGGIIGTLSEDVPVAAVDETSNPEAKVDVPDDQLEATPIFSKSAERLLRNSGRGVGEFAGRDFVTASDVSSEGVPVGAPLEAEPPGSLEGNPSEKVISPPTTGQLCGENASELMALIASDLYRYKGGKGFASLLHHFLFCPGFRVSAMARLCGFTRRNKALRYTIHPILLLLSYHWTVVFGIRIPRQLKVGSGLYIGHWGGIWINPAAVIGRDCNLSQEVSIGSAGPEARVGHPVIGDRVFIGPGSRIAGPIKIGRNVVIAANSLVTSNIPDNCVVAGVPAKIVSSVSGENRYISNTDYSGEESDPA